MSTSSTTYLPHESELGQWLLIRREPPASLHSYVLSYEGYVESAAHFGKRLQTATTKIPLILNLGAPYDINTPSAPAREWRSFIAGLHDGPTYVGAQGLQHCIQVDLTPLAARTLLGYPMHELTGRLIDIEDIGGVRFADLVERLGNIPNWNARFDLLDRFLEVRFARATAPPPEMSWAWQQLRASRGTLSIGQLAHQLDRSHRHLIAQFRAHIGLPPKLAARILRFEHAAAEGVGMRAPCWATVASTAGYFDQAHLYRDFRQFAGVTPGEYHRRTLPDEAGFAGDSQPLPGR